ncbi:FdhF/YdeP family oxidoreductase [Marininema halotolerans]|uniref:Oxidoreductase alpha (Molybdopterin) subunit n=1 Tax=Marininema halotolerans TaxID=1155944 RepID=A0A1I6QDI5_9BACL|nr:FdhF/YdeP family oxidoreductase [Marininema halotolerans]SFS50504.1 oxidoreductase alpha (molybdopterin) subunit [Marininema halotolerans]
MGKTKHSGPTPLPKTPQPNLWVSPIPFGIGKIKPHHIWETTRVAWENRDNLRYATRILTQGVCDGCALGVAGLTDQTLTGPHLCTTRLNLLRLNTMAAIPPEILHDDIDQLRRMNNTQLRKLGRIPYPLLREAGECKFRRISWEEALQRIAQKMKHTAPHQYAFYLTSRGITNESYYAAGKVARFLGTNHIDNASRICHSPSKTALKRSLGIGASSCSYNDWIGTDVLVFWGSVAATNQPVSTKYMYAAKRKGTKIIVVNPYHEPSMDHYWIPSIPESALFGTKLADDFYSVNIGGDIAFMNGVMKHWFAMEEKHSGSAINHSFVSNHTHGSTELQKHVCQYEWTDLEKSSGLTREQMISFAECLAQAKSAVFVWSMGLTQHRFGTDNISQVANLAMLRGFIGRKHCGVMPIRGHSGVQGAGEMGADPFSLPGGGFEDQNLARLETLWNFPIPRWQGDTVGVTLENALLPKDHNQRIKLYYLSGGNFLETMPDPTFVQDSLQNLEVRVHQDIILNTSTLLDAQEAVIVLPAMTRYEQNGGGTSTSTERMVYFSPEIPGPRIEEARPEWEIYRELAKHILPNQIDRLGLESAKAIREEIAQAAPEYNGIQHLNQKGDLFQWGGAWLCEDGICPTPDGRGHLLAIDLPERRKGEDEFTLTTRRGKQFNSMIYSEVDPFNQAEREDILIHKSDAKRLHIKDGDAIVLHNNHGRFHGKARLAPIRAGNLAVHWPEGNTLFPKGLYEKYAQIPEYNGNVILEKAEIFYGRKEKREREKNKSKG